MKISFFSSFKTGTAGRRMAVWLCIAACGLAIWLAARFVVQVVARLAVRLAVRPWRAAARAAMRRMTVWLCGFAACVGGARAVAAEPVAVFPVCLRPAFGALYLPEVGVVHPALLAGFVGREAATDSALDGVSARGRDRSRPYGGANGWGSGRVRGCVGLYSHVGFIRENQRTGVSGAWWLGRQTLALHYEFEGFALYHTHAAGFSYATAFTEDWRGGVFVRYKRRNRIEDKADVGAVESGLSVAGRLGAWDLSFKAAYEIPLQSRGIWQQALGLLLTASYALSEDLCIGAEVGKDIRYPFEAAVGAAYRMGGHFLFFGQCGVYPLRLSLGGGYTSSRMDVLVSAAYHPPLGATCQIGLSWKVR